MNKNPRILHFNNYGHVALTLASLEIPTHPNWYVLGMSLAHKNDNGSRFIGRSYALESLEESLTDFQLRDLIKNMMAEEVKSLNCVPCPIKGQKGHYLVHGVANIKLIVAWLRRADKGYSFSKKNSVFHKAFFQLPDTWERHINGYKPVEKLYPHEYIRTT